LQRRWWWQSDGRIMGLAFGDLNLDLRMDFVVGVRSYRVDPTLGENRLEVFLGEADGFRAHASLPIEGVAQQVLIAQLGGDRTPDVALVDDVKDEVLVCIGTALASFLPCARTRVDSGAESLLSADVDGDGDTDLFAHGSWDGVVLFGDGTGRFLLGPHAAIGVGVSWAGMHDLDGDGRPEILVARSSARELRVLRWERSGEFRIERFADAPTRPRDLVLADFDGDRHADVVVSGVDPCGCFGLMSKKSTTR
jgi:FG-GAP-like repeat